MIVPVVAPLLPSSSKFLQSYLTRSPPPPSLLIDTLSSSTIGITLNLPKSFNALNHTQVSYLSPLYAHLLSESTPPYVIFKGADTGKKTKSFCSGGDVVQIYKEGLIRYQNLGDKSTLNNVDGTDIFFRDEYKLNNLISNFKSQISIWDGICMGGGVGLSIHGSHRVSTSRTVFAMPESGIGLFPDVGGSAWMPGLGGWGIYLGVTGERVKGETARRLGLSTCHVGDWESVEEKVIERLDGGEDAGEVLASVDEGGDERGALDDLIDECFEGKFQIGEIFEALEKSEHGEAERIKGIIETKSPTSVEVTLEQLRRGKSMSSISDCLEMEFNISQAMMQEPNGDFYEGIRAVLVDKDGAPKWDKGFGEVEVEKYFREAEEKWTP
ncbi:hypothetical protein TL16_g12171 [Triparma laevis f. inornata]|uniref:3-hydroxyisobutyryl-CoA hydrolase n=2 Tax=Triparma laevis TaxID=1534972 RepID=A0A9W7FFP1_9STRA|nr:hypothetical protein TL16_g12171 [Triparma laevis f. inornata]GMI11231.1 hypothetical protein TrLO_g15551 [Triparma laevis f. longispina]